MASAQHLGSARGIAIGAFTPVVADASAIDWNPAGLTGIRDWEITGGNYFESRGGESGLLFHGAGLGKRLAPEHAAALRVTPGLTLELAVPSKFVVGDSSFTAEYEKEISYRDVFAFGYAFRPGQELSLGASAHFLEEKVTDTEYAIDSNGVVSSTQADYTGQSWSLDWGLTWTPSREWRIGAVAKNLFRITESSLPESVGDYALALPKTLRLGAAWDASSSIMLAAEGDFEKYFRTGTEWRFADGFAAQGSIWWNGNDWASGLLFFDQTNREGTAGVEVLSDPGIAGIEYNALTGNRVTVSFILNLGRSHDQLARIEYVEMLSDVYPSSSTVHAFRPIGKARVRNVSPGPIDATVSFMVPGMMDRPTESRVQTIPSGDAVEIPLYAVFGEAVMTVSTMIVTDGEIAVSATATRDPEDRVQTRVLVRGRNDWNGEVADLRYFVTPDDPGIIAETRSILGASPAAVDSADPRARNLQRARALFESFRDRLMYVNDPRKSRDHVQFPSETVALRGGDCDDTSVLFASMLLSIGIRAAFVDVVPPDNPEGAHIYVMFDTGIGPDAASLVSDNPKRYVIRKRADASSTIWLPVETTVPREGFEKSWTMGAEKYFQDVEVASGLAHGWVRIVDLETGIKESEK
jgi:hypothetical protein